MKTNNNTQNNFEPMLKSWKLIKTGWQEMSEINFFEGQWITDIIDKRYSRIFIEDREIKNMKLFKRDKRPIEIRAKLLGGAEQEQTKNTKILF